MDTLFNDEKLKEFVDSFDSLLETNIDKDLESQVFNQLIEIEGLSEYLRRTMGEDVKRSFTAPTSQHEYIKGHFALAAFLYTNLKKYRQIKDSKETPKK